MVLEARNEKRIKCVVVGDDSIGKTSMLLGYATNRYPTQHVPSVFDNHAGSLKLAGRRIKLELIDTVEEDERPIRKEMYKETDIFVVCFSVVQPDSLQHVQDIWLPEIRQIAPETPYILVGTQADLREVTTILRLLRSNGQKPISAAEGNTLARKLGATCYVEASPEVEKKVRRTINNALASVLKVQDGSRDIQANVCTIL
ncbi:cdc42 homolog [Haliotis asinina]|uniref:cdc42 homolog n=1 Tax=Haliotis asinina TaxID=109174 RepID=UPI003531D83E